MVSSWTYSKKAHCKQFCTEPSFRAAKTATVRQSDKQHEHSWNTTEKEDSKKEIAIAKSFHPRSLVFLKTEGNPRYLYMGDKHYQFRGMAGSPDQHP